MSFRGRLTAFFVAIVLVPIVVVTALLLQISGESAVGKADARLGAALETGQALYDEAIPESAAQAARIATLDGVAAALESGDRQTLDRVARRQASAPGIWAVGFYSTDGEELARRGAANAAVTSRRPVNLLGEEVGEIAVSTELAAPFVRSVAELVPVEVALVTDDQVTAASFEIEPDQLPPDPNTASTVTTAEGDLRAASLPLAVVPPTRLVMFDQPDNEGIGTSEPLVLAALAAFFLLALLLILYVVRALQRQIKSMLVAARRVGGGDFSHRVPVEGEDEMAGLAREFNRMSDRLADQVTALRRQQQELDRSVRRIGEAFASGLDRESLLEVVIEAAVGATEADVGAIQLELRGETSSISSTGTSDAAGGALAKAASGVVADGRQSSVECDGAYAIAQPLAAGGDESSPAGTLAVARTGEPFTENQLEILQYLGGQAAVSVENIGLHERVTAQAVTDGLTGLSNKRHFEEWMERELTRRGRFGGPLSVVLLDIDNFKDVNDDYGHLQGDEALRVVASVLKQVSREVDESARYGGEEFVMALPRTPKDGAMEVAERIRSGIEQATIPGIDGDEAIQVTTSVGVATIPDDSEGIDGAVAAADRALYAAKQAGKNRIIDASAL